MGMRKGKLGINFSFLASMAFMLIFFCEIIDFYLPVFLLAGLVMVVERDEWLTRQTLQACGVAIIYMLAAAVEGSGSSGLGSIPIIGSVIGIITTIISLIFWIPALIFNIMGWTRTAKGEEARLPIFGKWVEKAYGAMAPQYPPQGGQYPPQGGYPPQGQPMQQQYQQPGMGMQQPPMAPPPPQAPVMGQPAGNPNQQPPAPPPSV